MMYTKFNLSFEVVQNKEDLDTINQMSEEQIQEAIERMKKEMHTLIASEVGTKEQVQNFKIEISLEKEET